MSNATNRESLLKLLTLLRPALSTQNYIPALTHFQFADGWVTSFNDKSAISVKSGVEIEGCIPGELFLRALGSFNAENVSLQETGKDGVLQVSSGRSKVKLPTLKRSQFPYEAPKGNPDSFDLSDSILEGIRRCLFSVSNDPTRPAQMGITLDVDDRGMAVVYSTDNFTISRYQTSTKIKLPGDAPILLPTFFCEQLVALNRNYDKEDLVLKIYPGIRVAEFGKVAMLSTRISSDEIDLLDFGKIIARFGTMDEIKAKLSPIPSSFDAAFNRAVLVLSGEDDKSTSVIVGKGSIELFSESSMGESEDEVEWTGKPIDKTFYINPASVVRAIKTCSSVAFYARAMLLADAEFNFIHLINHSSAA